MLYLQIKRSLCEQVPRKAKKIVVVSAISTLMTGKKIEEEELERIPYIWYPVTFKDQTEALLDSRSEFNVMNPTLAS